MTGKVPPSTYRASLIVHIVVIAAIALSGALPACRFLKRPPRDKTIPIEFTVDVSSIDPPAREAPKDEPKPDPEPGKDEVVIPDKKPDPPKKDDPKKEEAPPEKPKKKPINVSKELVRRDPPKEPKKSDLPRVQSDHDTKLTQEEIRKMLDLGAKPSDKTVIPGDNERGLALVKQTLEKAWIKPTAEFRGSRPTELQIQLDSFGNVTGRRITSSSGSKVQDDSVMSAANAVRQIRNLPSGFARRHPAISIEFELTAEN